MKRIFKPLILVSILALSACGGSDDTPPVIPVSMFIQDRDIVEVGEDVAFTNESEDGATYSWDFGDNNTSTDPNPNHSYSRRGTFTVTLTTTSSTGDEAVSTSTVVVGRRWVIGIGIESISEVNSSAQPWDEDGSGPELLFGFIEATAPTVSPYTIGINVLNKDLPISGPIDPAEQVALTNTDWRFFFIDNDVPLDDLNFSDVMVTFDLNPVTIASEKDYFTGIGTFNFVGGPYEFVIAFEVRDE